MKYDLAKLMQNKLSEINKIKKISWSEEGYSPLDPDVSRNISQSQQDVMATEKEIMQTLKSLTPGVGTAYDSAKVANKIYLLNEEYNKENSDWEKISDLENELIQEGFFAAISLTPFAISKLTKVINPKLIRMMKENKRKKRKAFGYDEYSEDGSNWGKRIHPDDRPKTKLSNRLDYDIIYNIQKAIEAAETVAGKVYPFGSSGYEAVDFAYKYRIFLERILHNKEITSYDFTEIWYELKRIRYSDEVNSSILSVFNHDKETLKKFDWVFENTERLAPKGYDKMENILHNTESVRWRDRSR